MKQKQKICYFYLDINLSSTFREKIPYYFTSEKTKNFFCILLLDISD